MGTDDDRYTLKSAIACKTTIQHLRVQKIPSREGTTAPANERIDK